MRILNSFKVKRLKYFIIWNGKLYGLVLLVYALLSWTLMPYAQAKRSKLVPVTPENRDKCTQFMDIRGQSFCSTAPVYRGASTYDPVAFALPEDWHTEYWHNADTSDPKASDHGIFFADYFPPNETPQQWTQRVGTQGVDRKVAPLVSPRQYAKGAISVLPHNIKLPGVTEPIPLPQATVLAQNASMVVHELSWPTLPATQGLHGFQKAFRGEHGMLAVQYLTRQTPMSPKDHAHWRSIIESASDKFVDLPHFMGPD